MKRQTTLMIAAVARLWCMTEKLLHPELPFLPRLYGGVLVRPMKLDGVVQGQLPSVVASFALFRMLKEDEFVRTT